MDKIQHTTVPTNGINMHVASIGTGPRAILFLHGFPELWYTWRHQLLSLSSLGYRCIAPDLRGYGDTDCPAPAAQYTSLHIVGDLFRPDRVKALVNTSVPFTPRHPKASLIAGMRAVFGDDFYMCRFQEVGEAEADFGAVETGKLLAKILTSRNPDPPCLPKHVGFRGIPDLPALPSWLTQQDIDYFASKFDRTGFTGALNYYRAIDLSWEVMGPWTGAKVTVPTKFIVGELDITLKFPRMKDYVVGGGMKADVPLLEEVVVLEGVAHFLHEESPQQVTNHIHDFFKDK
ncbi:unnamed protein product [Linum tenue]|uniref:AB hydrolase-1 domain-containing protein n=1 Tax=Linum tenue TaxID=586396 RepID=A0AAV0KH51_9ROSI|nr:unnamed protein product [Linum tenue]